MTRLCGFLISYKSDAHTSGGAIDLRQTCAVSPTVSVDAERLYEVMRHV